MATQQLNGIAVIQLLNVVWEKATVTQMTIVLETWYAVALEIVQTTARMILVTKEVFGLSQPIAVLNQVRSIINILYCWNLRIFKVEIS